jgi:hypothetical protein
MPTRFRQHATARSPLPTAFSPLQSRSLTTAGSRQPLLIASGTPLQKCVSCRCNGYVHHGWLTPAALGAPRLIIAPKRHNAIRTAQTQRHRSGGRCSPPWLGNVLAVMNAVCERERSPTTAGWLTPAALGARCSFAAKALFAMDKRTFTGAAGVSPPWLGERDEIEHCPAAGEHKIRSGGRQPAVARKRCKRTSLAGSCQRSFAPDAVAKCARGATVHHGWLTPAALGARCSFAAKALFAMDKRTFTGAAGVSPPWLGERDAVPRESNIVQRLASTRSGAAGVSPPWLGNVLAVMNAVCERERSPTTAGSRQPLLIASRTPLQKCVSCRCNGYVHHGWLARFPPVQRLRSPRLALDCATPLHKCVSCRCTVAFTTAGSRQPLLVHGVRSLPKRYLRWTNAHSQERRASARRGSETYWRS